MLGQPGEGNGGGIFRWKFAFQKSLGFYLESMILYMKVFVVHTRTWYNSLSIKKQTLEFKYTHIPCILSSFII